MYLQSSDGSVVKVLAERSERLCRTPEPKKSLILNCSNWVFPLIVVTSLWMNIGIKNKRVLGPSILQDCSSCVLSLVVSIYRERSENCTMRIKCPPKKWTAAKSTDGFNWFNVSCSFISSLPSLQCIQSLSFCFISLLLCETHSGPSLRRCAKLDLTSSHSFHVA